MEKLHELVSKYRTGERCGSASLGDFAKQIQTIYIKIPEDDRRFCMGDMDSKDYEVKRILNAHNLKY